MRARLAHLPPMRRKSSSRAVSNGTMKDAAALAPMRLFPTMWSGSAPDLFFVLRRVPRRECVASGHVPFDPKRRRYAKRDVVNEVDGLVRSQPQAREPAAELAKRDRELDTCQLLADAGVNAVAERQMAPRVATPDVEAGRRGEHRLVAIGGADEQEDIGVFRHRHAADLSVLQCAPAPSHDGWAEAQG